MVEKSISYVRFKWVNIFYSIVSVISFYVNFDRCHPMSRSQLVSMIHWLMKLVIFTGGWHPMSLNQSIIIYMFCWPIGLVGFFQCFSVGSLSCLFDILSGQSVFPLSTLACSWGWSRCSFLRFETAVKPLYHTIITMALN